MLTGFVGFGLQMDLSTRVNQSSHSDINFQWLKGADTVEKLQIFLGGKFISDITNFNN